MNQFTPGNELTLLRNGAEYFPALLAAIDAAKDEIFLQTYIFELDQTGEHVSDALKQAASRGVSVFLLLDGFGCRNFPLKNIEALRSSGVEVLIFRPKISPWTLRRSRLRRLHAKLAVIDSEVGFVGGINIVDDFNTPSQNGPRIDYAVSVKGPLLGSMRENARLVWQRVCKRQFKKNHARYLTVDNPHSIQEGMQAAFLVRDNVKHRSDIEMAYLNAIKVAESEIIIANAYFLPGLRFRHALHDAAERGVNVILLLQERTEYAVLDFAMRALYSAFLNQNIHIYEYHKSLMHSKVSVIDSEIAIIGSSNVDPFSLFLSLEANVIVKNKLFANELRQSLKTDINDGSTLITLDEWQRYPYVKRILSWVLYGLIKLFTAFIGSPENT